jgi:tricorn protease-like protein
MDPVLLCHARRTYARRFQAVNGRIRLFEKVISGKSKERRKLKEAVMREMTGFSLFAVSVFALLCLISCTAKTNATEASIPSTNTQNSPIKSPSISATATYTRTPLPIPSTPILLLSSESPLPILKGRISFETDTIRNNVQPYGLVMYDIDRSEAVVLVEGQLDVNGKKVMLFQPEIAWSPDGHWLAYVGMDVNGNVSSREGQDVYLAKSDRTEVHRLTVSPEYRKWDLSWSPDGQSILLAMGISGSDLYLIDVNRGEIVKRLTSDGRNSSAAWSPDGKRIAVGAYSGVSILNMKDNTWELISFFSDVRFVDDIAWSPKNDQIAFLASVDGSSCNHDIFVGNLVTGGITNLTSSKSDENSPVWSPDGKYLAFSRSTYSCDAERRDD